MEKIKGISAFMLLTALLFAVGCMEAETSITNTIPEGATIVEITSAGFSPSLITINAGDTVAWINKDSVEHQPASAMHPTHEAYPEPGGCVGSKFDACRGLKNGEVFSFKFDQKGEWKYHDHLNCCTNPAFFGTIKVN